MSDVKRYHFEAFIDNYYKHYQFILASDYDALAAKLTMAEDAAAKGDAARQQCGGMEMEIEELRAELAELRARVVVVPNRLPRSSDIASIHHHSIGWNACLDELARINGMTVSEGLLRRIVTPALTSSDAQDRIGALEELCALLSEQA